MGSAGDDRHAVDGTTNDKEQEEDGIDYPHGIKLALIMGSSYLSMFLVALDRLIVTTAIPKITDEFHSVTDVGWYGSAYLLTNCAFQLFFGKLYVVYSVKAVFLSSILMFEIGSAVCGSAPSSVALIVGRALAGVGSAGIFSGAITLAQLDAPGLIALLGGVICLLLALEWGGTTYAWRNGRIIALLVIAILLMMSFIAVQIIWPNTATVPPRIFVQRSIMAAFFAMFTAGATMMTTVYYLPLWFQAVEGVSAVQSGIRLLPLVIGQVIGSLAGGIGIQKSGYYTPFMLFSIVLMSIGTGLLTTLQVNTSEGKWIGYQIPYGIGLGTTLQAPLLAAQTVLPLKDVPIGTSLMFFSQLLGGAIFVSVGQNLFDNYFVKDLAGVPGVNVTTILQQGATTIVDISEPTKGYVVTAYNDALRKVFITGLVMACITFLGAAAMEWKSVKKTAPKADAESQSEEAAHKASDPMATSSEARTDEKKLHDAP
ncbi:hypothetical protein SLS53_004373 [Cytospora paraplurivora]|uniref:Major facilitator superfamily (MFS) profile domain-containing protein n=1 Tax=Cytospora paraplurivora TaxID=2898453 RepID=A0AAN9UH40_9PEZI